MSNRIGLPGYWAALACLVLLAQYALPMVSDEAYFVSWGGAPALGYYDHPPMTGWVSAAIWQIGDLAGLARQGILHRLFALALGGLSLWLVARRAGRSGAEAAAVTLATIPGFLLLSNLWLNDTLLAFLCLLFVLATEAAMRRENQVWVHVLLAGLAFGLVLLTKYNGALIWLGMVAGFLTTAPLRRFLVTRFAAISLVAAVPFGWHIWWNFNHCSVNLAFNFSFRADQAAGYGPLWVVLTLLVMAGPAAIVLIPVLLRRREPRNLGLFARTFFGSIVVMFAVSVLRGEFGVNWGAPLAPIAVLAMTEFLPKSSFQLARRSGLALSVLLLLPLLVLLAGLKGGWIAPERLTSPEKSAQIRMQLDLSDGSLAAALAPLAVGRVPVATEYGIAASLGNAGLAPVVVVSQSVYGRNQDLATDFRALDGADMLVVPNHTDEAAGLAALFDSVEIVTVQTERRAYQVVLGRGFSYPTFRRDWILPVIERFYDKSRFAYSACPMAKYRDD